MPGRRAEVFDQLGAHEGRIDLQRLAVQLLELGDPGGAEQVGAAGEDLAAQVAGGGERGERHRCGAVRNAGTAQAPSCTQR
jgi:hypothetical protein